MRGVTDPYLREQLEVRRAELKAAIAAPGATEEESSPAPLVKLLQEWTPPWREWTPAHMGFAICATTRLKKTG